MIYLVVGVFSLVAAFYFFNSKYSVPTEEKLPEIPQEFRSYQSMLDGFESASHSVQRIVGPNESSYAKLRYYHPADSTLIVLTNNYSGLVGAPNPWIDTYLKLNKEGTVVDHLSSPYYVYREILGYLLARDHYSSWAIDGDTTSKLYENGSLDTGQTQAAMLENFATFYEKAEIVQYRKDLDKSTKTWIHSAYLFIDSKWHSISQGDLLNFEELYTDYPSKPHFEKRESLQLGTETTSWTKDTEVLQLVHFQKTKFQKERSNGTFSSTNATLPATWNGIAYMNLKLAQDTVPFKLGMRQDEASPSESLLPNGGTLRLYQNAALDFIILGHGEGQLFCFKTQPKVQ